MSDRRTFTIQLYPGGGRHKHNCEICHDQFHCGDTDCPGPDTDDTCIPCCERYDCPQCGTDVHGSLEWIEETIQRGDDGSETLINHFTAKCPDCGTGIVYQGIDVDGHDTGGIQRVMWTPSDPTAPQHIPAASFKGSHTMAAILDDEEP